MEHPTTPPAPPQDSTIMEDMVWYCVQSMLAPLLPPDIKAAPVTSFDWGPAFKAVKEREGHRTFTGDLVMAQALRMRDAERANARLARREEERKRGEAERESQAQRDKDQMGEFSMD